MKIDKEKTKAEITDRTPDIDGETFRAWIPIEKEQEREKKNAKEKGYEISFRGIKVSLTGFVIVTDKDTGELIIAYKFKHDNKDVLYYVPEDKEEHFNEVIRDFRNIIISFGYTATDMKPSLKEIWEKEDVFEELAKDKKKEIGSEK